MDQLQGLAFLLVGLVVVCVIASFDFEDYVASQIRTEEDSLKIVFDKSVVDWGVVEPGSLVYRDLKVSNNDYVDMDLSFYCENWIPVIAKDYLILTWSYDGSVLKKKQFVDLQFCLNVSQEVHTFIDFSFDIVIVADEI